MRHRLLVKLLLVNVLVIGFVVVIVWLAIDYLAADYFMTLMEKYNISPAPAHAMFLEAVHRYLLWACLGAVLLALGLGGVMLRRILAPLGRMMSISGQIAAGHYDVALPVTTRDEIGQLAAAFNRMARSLREIERLRKTMMIDVAHELRTPLTNIRGYLEALADGVLPPSRETFATLLEETQRLAQLVEDIMQLASADAARGQLSRQPVHLPTLLVAIRDELRMEFEARGIALGIRKADVPTISADPRLLAQVLRNLLRNAAQYTPAGGALEIAIHAEADVLRTRFCNSGAEIEAADLPYIFERFYRGEKSRSRMHGGAGLGLAIVKELVSAHGGQVGAEFEDGRTCIWFTLPSVPPTDL
jgi:two-component system sensor histidine kinase BaeS